ncbi:TetR/AcrR family transcriptional regulator [Corynebacterium pseudopelargi]|uniref:HTH-type transcriptional repressor FabR n=1 Tax=Corynebacterium pseudopelargi TaxID=2080757 RepID=A0A3G6ITK0_9CORY|nr:TetR/AcrR family transcriptional regulator [Corynebacterium pseudopelargi]AZA09039.1 HTH-type transcriptional repressor FabR [Corynebacterium pseudopelargi]
MSTSNRENYHHGDLRTALLQRALAMLQTSPSLSLRGLAKEEGVSPTAVYRHFSDKQALESALAAHGYNQLHLKLQHTNATIERAEDLWRMAYTYVVWAQENQPLFSLMFTTECDPTAPERVKAVREITSFLASQIAHWYPKQYDEAFLSAIWSLVHGMATLAMQGKIFSPTPAIPAEQSAEELQEHVRTCWQALMATAK